MTTVQDPVVPTKVLISVAFYKMRGSVHGLELTFRAAWASQPSNSPVSLVDSHVAPGFLPLFGERAEE